MYSKQYSQYLSCCNTNCLLYVAFVLLPHFVHPFVYTSIKVSDLSCVSATSSTAVCTYLLLCLYSPQPRKGAGKTRKNPCPNKKDARLTQLPALTYCKTEVLRVLRPHLNHHRVPFRQISSILNTTRYGMYCMCMFLS